MPNRKPLDPTDQAAEEFAATMKAVDRAGKVDQDEADIAADDAGATALGQKIDAVKRGEDKPKG